MITINDILSDAISVINADVLELPYRSEEHINNALDQMGAKKPVVCWDILTPVEQLPSSTGLIYFKYSVTVYVLRQTAGSNESMQALQEAVNECMLIGMQINRAISQSSAYRDVAENSDYIGATFEPIERVYDASHDGVQYTLNITIDPCMQGELVRYSRNQ